MDAPIMMVPKIKKLIVSRKSLPCPKCGLAAKRERLSTYWARDIGIKGPVILEITQSMHRCIPCGNLFSAAADVTPPKIKFTWRIIKTALDHLSREGETLQSTKDYMLGKFHVALPLSTLCGWKARYGEFPFLSGGGYL